MKGAIVMDNTPICPHCITELEYDDMIDNNYNGSHHDSKWVGHCHICNKKFVWHEVYLFDHIEEFEEEIDDG
jgi:hypothetical protein